MQDLAKRDKANSKNPAVGDTVYVDAYGIRGVVTEVLTEYDQTSYKIDLENGQKTRRLRRELIRVRQ